MIKAEILRAIVECEAPDLRKLADIAQGNPESFYRGANFDDADLRGQDLRGFDLTAATFHRARIDRHTKVDARFQEEVGLKRIAILLSVKVPLSAMLHSYNIPLDVPSEMHLGDIIEIGMNSLLLSTRRINKIPASLRTHLVWSTGIQLKDVSGVGGMEYTVSFRPNNPSPRSFRGEQFTCLITRRTFDEVRRVLGSSSAVVPLWCLLAIFDYLEKLDPFNPESRFLRSILSEIEPGREFDRIDFDQIEIVP